MLQILMSVIPPFTMTVLIQRALIQLGPTVALVIQDTVGMEPIAMVFLSSPLSISIFFPMLDTSVS